MIINTTPHEITFQKSHHFCEPYSSTNPCCYCGAWDDEQLDVPCVTYTVPPCGVLVNARPVEEPAGAHPGGAELVRTRFEADPASEEALDRLEHENPGAVIVGSIIAAQAFPGRVLAMVPAPGFERVPPAEKRMRDDKFTTFDKRNYRQEEEARYAAYQAAKKDVNDWIAAHGSEHLKRAFAAKYECKEIYAKERAAFEFPTLKFYHGSLWNYSKVDTPTEEELAACENVQKLLDEKNSGLKAEVGMYKEFFGDHELDFHMVRCVAVNNYLASPCSCYGGYSLRLDLGIVTLEELEEKGWD